MSAALLGQLVDRTAGLYRHAGHFAFHFARGKLSGDPVFAALLREGLIPNAARIVDLGCGQGLLAAWLHAVSIAHAAGDWPSDWPVPPAVQALRGVDLSAQDIQRARIAFDGVMLGQSIPAFEVGDVRATDFGNADLIVMLDVLHYLTPAQQEQVLRKVWQALPVHGVLLLRVGDARGGWKFRFSLIVDRIVAWLRGRGWNRLHCRALDDWLALLARVGFTVRVQPINPNAPFANALLVARRD